MRRTERKRDNGEKIWRGEGMCGGNKGDKNIFCNFNSKIELSVFLKDTIILLLNFVDYYLNTAKNCLKLIFELCFKFKIKNSLLVFHDVYTL